jgi:hypothetical protein
VAAAIRLQIQTRLSIGAHWQVQGSVLHASHSHLHVRRVGLVSQSVFFLLLQLQLRYCWKSAVVLYIGYLESVRDHINEGGANLKPKEEGTFHCLPPTNRSTGAFRIDLFPPIEPSTSSSANTTQLDLTPHPHL